MYVKMWIVKNTNLGNRTKTLLSKAYTNYQLAVLSSGSKPLGKRAFKKEVQKNGYEVKRGTGNQMYIYGLELGLLQRPEKVRPTTFVELWVEERCVTTKSGNMELKDAYKDFNKWCKYKGAKKKVLNDIQFSIQVAALFSIRSEEKGGRVSFDGLKLKV